jgi:hypothetical protein
MRFDASPPEIRQSVIQLYCEGCGCETTAKCSCGKAYKPKAVAQEAVEAHPEKSNRMIAKEVGVSEPTVRRARAVSASATQSGPRIGLDGVTRAIPKPTPKPPPTMSSAVLDNSNQFTAGNCTKEEFHSAGTAINALKYFISELDVLDLAGVMRGVNDKEASELGRNIDLASMLIDKLRDALDARP